VGESEKPKQSENGQKKATEARAYQQQEGKAAKVNEKAMYQSMQFKAFWWRGKKRPAPDIRGAHHEGVRTSRIVLTKKPKGTERKKHRLQHFVPWGQGIRLKKKLCPAKETARGGNLAQPKTCRVKNQRVGFGHGCMMRGSEKEKKPRTRNPGGGDSWYP